MALGLGACDRPESPVAATSPSGVEAQQPEPVADARKAAVLGDATRLVLLDTLAMANNSRLETSDGVRRVTITTAGGSIELSTPVNNDLRLKAKLAATSDVVFLALDSTEGPMPVHREDILLARQSAVQRIVPVFTRTNLVDDAELLELEELEIRELLNKYKMDGDKASVILDTPVAAKRRNLKPPSGDLTALADGVMREPKRVHQADSGTFRDAKAAFYVLTSQELALRGVTEPPRAGKYELLVGASSGFAEVKFDQVVSWGSNVDGSLQFESPLSMFEGKRFIMLRDGHIIAVGVVTSLQSK
jgi:translation elongation factor EF-Tu-like GTPase